MGPDRLTGIESRPRGLTALPTVPRPTSSSVSDAFGGRERQTHALDLLPRRRARARAGGAGGGDGDGCGRSVRARTAHVRAPARRVPRAAARGYLRREPEATVLHRAVREHLASFLGETRERSPHGAGLPHFVEREFAGYLDCGLLARGFSRVRCGDCGHELLGFHEAGKPCSIARASARLFEERTQVSADGGVQQGALGLAPAPPARERTAGCAGESLVRPRRFGSPCLPAVGHAARRSNEPGQRNRGRSRRATERRCDA